MRACLRLLRVLAVVAVVGTGLVAAHTAQASTPIGPNQHFIGLVNGKHVGAVISVICPGPVGGTVTGPPLGNQSVSVQRVYVYGGNTGSAGHEIWAQFDNAPPFAAFTFYNTPKPIPTSLRLPCEGAGTVTFTTRFGTIPCATNARPNRVPVTFVNLGV